MAVRALAMAGPHRAGLTEERGPDAYGQRAPHPQGLTGEDPVGPANTQMAWQAHNRQGVV